MQYFAFYYVICPWIRKNTKIFYVIYPWTRWTTSYYISADCRLRDFVTPKRLNFRFTTQRKSDSADEQADKVYFTLYIPTENNI